MDIQETVLKNERLSDSFAEISMFDIGNLDLELMHVGSRNSHRSTVMLDIEFEEERVLIIENLWEMVFADGIVHELEDNVVWRIAELLGVDSRDRMLLKQKVWKRRSEETVEN